MPAQGQRTDSDMVLHERDGVSTEDHRLWRKFWLLPALWCLTAAARFPWGDAWGLVDVFRAVVDSFTIVASSLVVYLGWLAISGFMNILGEVLLLSMRISFGAILVYATTEVCRGLLEVAILLSPVGRPLLDGVSAIPGGRVVCSIMTATICVVLRVRLYRHLLKNRTENNYLGRGSNSSSGEDRHALDHHDQGSESLERMHGDWDDVSGGQLIAALGNDDDDDDDNNNNNKDEELATKITNEHMSTNSRASEADSWSLLFRSLSKAFLVTSVTWVAQILSHIGCCATYVFAWARRTVSFVVVSALICVLGCRRNALAYVLLSILT